MVLVPRTVHSLLSTYLLRVIQIVLLVYVLGRPGKQLGPTSVYGRKFGSQLHHFELPIVPQIKEAEIDCRGNQWPSVAVDAGRVVRAPQAGIPLGCPFAIACWDMRRRPNCVCMYVLDL